MSELHDRFRKFCGEKLDISEHLGLLRGLACDPNVESIVELGFRTGVSATALATAGKPLHGYDIDRCVAYVRPLRAIAPNFFFEVGDSLKITIPKCDLLHIDSKHTYAHLKAELDRHHESVRRYIALHDSETFKLVGKDGSKPGLQQAITEFLDANRQSWTLQLHLTNNNGLSLLRRKT